MATIFELQAETREGTGRGASRRLRRAEQVPAILYGAGDPAKSLVMTHKSVMKALEQEAFYSHILTLNVKSLFNINSFFIILNSSLLRCMYIIKVMLF